ncbi:MAG: hypothetical protein WC897_05025 [Candidatus Gracilibacteria bacterium]
MSIKLINRSLLDPWKIQRGLALLDSFDSDSKRIDPHSTEYKNAQVRTHINDKMDLTKGKAKGEMAWNGVNKLNESDIKKQKELADSLQEFQNATGINEQKYIEEIDNCKSSNEIDTIEKKLEKTATKWYKEKMLKSGAFEHVVDKEQKLLEDEMNGLAEWFGDLPLYGNDISMIETLKELDKNLEIKKRFRTKLQKQTTFVKDEYARRLGSLAMIGSKEQLLENILKEIKEVEDAPSSIQYEFKKVQKSANATKDTATLKKNVIEGYNTRFERYRKVLMQNIQYFGGEDIVSKWGKLPETAFEFLDWLEERKNFAEMDSAIKNLPKMISDRKRLYDKRDKILENALPEERKKIFAQTHLMRRHELEAYLPELATYVRNKNIHVAEFIGAITIARTNNVELFQSFEKVLEIRKFKLADFDTQKAKILVLKQEIQEREKTVRAYFKLPTYLRDDNAFIKANSFDREQMLMKAEERFGREQKNPFDLSTVDHLDNEEMDTVEEKLESEAGDKMMEEVTKELKQEGEMETVKIQAQTYKRIFGTQKYARDNHMTQKERYKDDLAYWIKFNRTAKTENDITDNRQLNKWRFLEKADEGYDLGYVFNSGGEIRDLQKIKKNELKYGNTKVYEKLSFAKYNEHIMIEDEEGKDAKDPIKMIEDLSEKELTKLVMVAITKLGKGRMHLSESNMSILKNSQNIKKDIANKFIDEQFQHLKMDSTNNTDHFANEVAIAA